MDQLAEWGYLGMFISAFLAGSIVPANSELVMSALLALGYDKWPILVTATIGNLLGGMTCYYLGYLGKMEWITKYARIKESRVQQIHNFLEGRGAWLAVLVFVPFIGDAIIVVFGLMRSNFLIVSIAMGVGKLFKYLVWMYLSIGVIELVAQ